MKQMMATLAFVAICVPVYAQFGSLDKAVKKVQQADDLMVSEEEERTIGESVSAKIRDRFGVVQDPAVHKYVTLVGTLVAQESERPKLAWTFIVLDTDGVNAFASPGGLIHITRGALGLLKNEAELAGVLAHEIGHVAHKHTVNAIKKNKAVALGTNEALADRGPFLDKMANKAYEMVLENSFDRGDELDADKQSVALTQKLGYAPAAMAEFLVRLDDRNKDQAERNGLFASHPETKERVEKLRQLASASKSSATAASRYTQHIKYEPTPITAIAVVTEGSAGLTGSGSGKDAGKDKSSDKDKKADDQSKKKGFGLGSLKPTAAPERQSAQVSASGGARGIGPDRAAKGGSNSAMVRVTVTSADLIAFKKGIA